MNYAIGIDLGGTTVKALALSTRGKVLAQYRALTQDQGNAQWKTNVRDAFRHLLENRPSPPTWIGIAAPGLPARDGRSIAFMPGRLAGLEGLDWQRFLRVPQPVTVLNDAQAALLAETWKGAARGSQNAILLTLGTGVGGAALVDGRLLRGHLGRAGHLGHISLNPHGPPDVTHTPGSLEDAIGEATLNQRSNGRFNTTRDLVSALPQDTTAHRVWHDSIRALAAAIAGLINVLDPEIIVIGGGIATSGPALFRPLRRHLDRFEWRPGGAKVRIVPAKLGDKAGAIGAAYHAILQIPIP